MLTVDIIGGHRWRTPRGCIDLRVEMQRGETLGTSAAHTAGAQANATLGGSTLTHVRNSGHPSGTKHATNEKVGEANSGIGIGWKQSNNIPASGCA
jgi:hypothetical protein